MNDDGFGLMVRRREIFESLAKGARRQDWPKLWEQAERSARAGAMAVRTFNPDRIYQSLARSERTRWKVDRTVLERMRRDES